MLNQVVLAGNLGGDPEISFYGDEGKPVASFSLGLQLVQEKDRVDQGDLFQ